jgi:D-alanine-D-alanine ligase-like ATP-grasp enzyme
VTQSARSVRDCAGGSAATSDVRARIRAALTGTHDAPLVLLGNFEVEEQWARGEVGLPRFDLGAASRPIVNHMDEFAVVLGSGQDHVLVKSQPDPDYLDYLTALGLTLPNLLWPGDEDPHRPVTADVLADPALLAQLAWLGQGGCRLVPHGVSDLEEELARRSGLPLATPSAATCKTVNSKIYSRSVATELGLRQAPGRTCDTLEELTEALAWAEAVLDTGARVVVKDAFGVSGKGVTVVEDAQRLGKLRRLVESGARREGHERVALVVEEWVAKTADLNYHLTVGRDGSVSVDFVLEAITDNGVHKGHRMPARLTSAQVAELTDAAAAIGARLAADGYFGVVGVDAMIAPDGGLYSVVEINARNNMSTYQAVCRETLVARDDVALARHYPIRPRHRLSFAAVRRALGPSLYDPRTRRGFAVNNFATVNACVPPNTTGDTTYDGRLYGVLVADSDEQLAALDHDITDRLNAGIQEGRQ